MYLKDCIVQIDELSFRRGEKYAGNVLRLCIVGNIQQFRGPLQIAYLIQLRSASEHQVIACASGALLQHQQTQFVLLAENPFANYRHLLGRQMVDVHTHRGTHPFAAFQRTVVVRQTRIVHLHQLRLPTFIARTNSLQYLLLFATITQGQIFLTVLDGAHHFHPVLVINHVCTHNV